MRARLLVLGAGALLAATGFFAYQSRARALPLPQRHVIGFVVPWDPYSRESLLKHAGALTEVALPAFTASMSGDVTDATDPVLLQTAQSVRKPILGIVGNFVDRKFDPQVAHRVCDTAAHRQAFAAALTAAAKRRGLAGLNLDLENIAPADARGYVRLAQAVRDRCRAEGLSVSVDIPATRKGTQVAGFDLKGLGAAADFVVAMLYDEHGPAAEPGPVASHRWVERGVDSMLARVPASKLVIGLGTYGYDWSTGPGQEVSFTKALALATAAGKSIDWDDKTRAPHFDYYDGKRVHHVWFEDAGTATSRLAPAGRQGCLGVALWRLGDEDPELWRLTDAYRSGRTTMVAESSYPMPAITTLAGGGDLFTVDRGNSDVSRSMDWVGQVVVEEDYSPLHPSFAVRRYVPVDPKMVALTFDDGPAGDFTPKILDELKAANVKATFFLIGQNVAEHPEIVRRLYAEGHDIGNHTYTHPHMEAISPVQARLEVNLNQRLIESVVGHRTVLFRRPYDVNNAPQDEEEIAPLLAPADAGYLLCGASIDPADWSGASTSQIVASCLKQLNQAQGHVIVMHDGGGPRDQTLAAVPILIRELRRRGYRFVTLHEMVGRSRDLVMAPAGAEPLITKAGIAAVGAVLGSGIYGQGLMIAGVVFLLVRLLLTTAGALWQFRQSRGRAPVVAAADGPLATVIVPAYNEEKVIARTIESLLASTYRNLEILVIDDGSSDGTFEAAKGASDDPRVRVMTKENGGKGRALNFGLRQARGERIIAIDADTMFERETIAHLVTRLEDPLVGAVAGNIKVGNRDTMLARWQNIEYIVGINLDKRFFDLLGCVPVVPGAVGAWRKEAIEAVGGYSTATMAEDADLTLSVQRAGWRVVYEDRAVAWTEAPDSWRDLFKQRLRWTFGTLQCLWKHRAAFFNGRAGTLGLIALPYIAFYHLLLLAGPLVDACFVLGCLAGWWQTMLVLSIPYLAAELGMAAVAFRMDGEPVRSLLPLLLQRFGYRQLIYWTMFRSVAMACQGTRLGWQKPRRLAALAAPAAHGS